MSDYVTNANQEAWMDLVDWSFYEGGGMEDADDESDAKSAGPSLAQLDPLEFYSTILGWDFEPTSLEPASSCRWTTGEDEDEASHLMSTIWDTPSVNSSSPLSCGTLISTATHSHLNGSLLSMHASSSQLNETPVGNSCDVPEGKLSVSSTNNSEDETPETLACPYYGCSFRARVRNRRSTKTIKNFDLERHINCKHIKSKPFVCPARGCFKRQNQTAFARPDKLTAHFRTMHSEDTMVECPHEDCSSNYMLAHVLPVHMRMAHRWQAFRRSEGRLYWHQLLGDLHYKRSCPVPTCKVRVHFHRLRGHLEAHVSMDINISTEGWSPYAVVIGQETSSNRVHIVCPICRTPCEDTRDFDQHLKSDHRPPYVGPTDLIDLKAHRREILRADPDFGTSAAWDDVWDDWTKLLRVMAYYAVEQPVSANL